MEYLTNLVSTVGDWFTSDTAKALAGGGFNALSSAMGGGGGGVDNGGALRKSLMSSPKDNYNISSTTPKLSGSVTAASTLGQKAPNPMYLAKQYMSALG